MRSPPHVTAWLLGALILPCLPGWAQQKASRDAPLPESVRARESLSVVLGRPTDRSITLNLLGSREQDCSVEIAPVPGSWEPKCAPRRLEAGVPLEVTLDGLEPDREYHYRLLAREPGATSFSPGPEGRFRTQRAPGATWSFQVIGDSHPERPQQFDPELYAQTLAHVAAESPDFFLTIGDDFSVDTLANVTKEAVQSIYRRQRLYLSLVGSVAPIFLVNGNHEQAALANLDGTADNVAVWAQNQRNSLFPQPAPDGFYTGDAQPVPQVGLLRDYYAWTWDDALFVVIDPYWHSEEPVDNVLGGGEKTRDLWQVTLGREQYDWFRDTLERSDAAYKFVFAHHVSGTGRGGAERAPFYEWGGRSPNGRDEFGARRPGWAAPIHELMARNGVTAFVQGHDHLFAREDLDGVTYITLPEPADPSYALYNDDAFLGADIVPNSGRVRFTVSPERVVVEYLREWLPQDHPASGDDLGPAYRFEIPRGGGPGPGEFDERQVSPSGPTGGEQGGRKQNGRQKGRDETPAKGRRGQEAAEPIAPAGDLHAGTLLEFPGATGVGVATAFTRDVEYCYRYGEADALLDRSTPLRSAAAGTVARDTISGLSPGTAYAFRLAWREPGAAEFTLSEPGRFTTVRAPGTGYTFAVEADPHLDENSSGELYAKTLERMARGAPDFVVDLGDTSMAEKLASDEAGYLARNQLVRSYWDGTGSSAPIFMVLGNHDGERGGGTRDGKPSGAEAAAMRRTWLIDPRVAPDGEYDVFSDTAYSFSWGDAMYVVLDPYSAAPAKPTDDGWSWTLGRKQYDWLAGVLARSTAAYRFVFIHNLVGGNGKEARGGADWADRYEWGGLGPNGADEFAERRPGWPMPVHDLLRKYGVDVVFHGHDHFYAEERRDGIIYQLVPQPSLAREQRLDDEQLAEYGYTSGVFLPSPGWLEVSVSPDQCRVEYLRSADGTVGHAYTIAP